MYFKIIRILNYFSDHDFDVARLRIYNLEKMGSYFSSHFFRILKNIKNQKFYPNLRIYSLEKTGILFYKPIFKIKEKIFEQRKHSKNEKKINRNLKIMTVKIFFFCKLKKERFSFLHSQKIQPRKDGGPSLKSVFENQ